MNLTEVQIPISFTGDLVYAEPLSGREVVDDDTVIYESEDYNYTVDMSGNPGEIVEELSNKSGVVLGVVGEDKENDDRYARLPISGTRSIQSGRIRTEESVEQSYEIWAVTDEIGQVELELEPVSSGLTGLVSRVARAVFPFLSPREAPTELENEFQGTYNVLDAEYIKKGEEEYASQFNTDAEELDSGVIAGDLQIEEMDDGSIKYNAFIIYEYTEDSPIEPSTSSETDT